MQTAAEKIAGAFYTLGVDYVLDIALARHLSLVEAARELSRLKEQERKGGKKETLLSSTCPGFVCYAEKSQGSILVPMLSRIKSPQQIMGLLVKKRFHLFSRNGSREKTIPLSIYHITLMPCYDKKLEASRLDNRLGEKEVPEVDCVITPIEVEKLLEICSIKLPDVDGRRLDLIYEKFYPTAKGAGHGLVSHVGSGAGGYAENLFRFIASHMYAQQVQKGGSEGLKKLSWKTLRNTDYLELKLFESGTTTAQESSEKVLLSFAILNGFRNVQNLVSRVKRKTCTYDYVEVSACPKGCLNGGAQLRNVSVDATINLPETVDPAAVAFEQVQRLYENLPKEQEFGLEIPHLELEQLNLANRQLYEALEIDEDMIKQMRTRFAVVEKTFNILNSNW